VVAGVLGTSRAMFISSHDLRVLLPVTAVAAAVGLAVALGLGVAGVRDVDRLRGRARLLGTGRPAGGPPAGRAHDRPRLRIRELDEIDAELVSARARLDDARQREQALEASRRDLIAWVSHDLRTPLAGLRAMAEALEDGVAADPTRYHRQMRREVDRLAGMVDDLFELSRIQAGALTLTLGPVDLFDVVDDVVQGSLPMAEAGGVRLGADAVHAAVRADPGELSRVLANLVVNAIRHTPSDGSVQVAGRVEGEHAVLSVSDGCGGLGAEELDENLVLDVRQLHRLAAAPDLPRARVNLNVPDPDARGRARLCRERRPVGSRGARAAQDGLDARD